MLASARGGRGNASRASAFHPKVKLRPRRECEIKTPAQEERVPEKKDPEIPLETLSEVELDAIVDHQCEEPLSLQEAPSDSVPTLAPPAPVPDLVMPSSVRLLLLVSCFTFPLLLCFSALKLVPASVQRQRETSGRFHARNKSQL
ncbi:uncharacterized protein LOC9631888 [Selaginella moellendorffii]|uniref:uncharacterized protein LOC9631888 n=1 Tax=Selaginella moellendorffii TaxID=88036 RepID=UPI000D1C9EFC|nr:uncharacterized protein LOC9631888 [Selaginella moellendorffii]|eukprot:XP_024521145.1 uncharacterized protein LOC9631888 [Selaginella moellendorffii]